jgi:hypothetical protein
MRAFVSAPYVDRVEPMIGSSATERRYAQKRLSFYSVLRSLWGHALKADQALFKPTVKLKANSPESQV